VARCRKKIDNTSARKSVEYLQPGSTFTTVNKNFGFHT